MAVLVLAAMAAFAVREVAAGEFLGTSTTTTAAPADAAASGPEAACTGSNAFVKMFSDASPQCFQRCPALCGAMRNITGRFAATTIEAFIEKHVLFLPRTDKHDIAQHVCEGRAAFGCALQPDNAEVCQSLFTAGLSFHVPQTTAELSRQCGVAAMDPTSAAYSVGPLKLIALMLFGWAFYIVD